MFPLEQGVSTSWIQVSFYSLGDQPVIFEIDDSDSDSDDAESDDGSVASGSDAEVEGML